MKDCAAFYHVLFNGTARPINTGFAMDLMSQQMATFVDCRLCDHVKEFHIGVNGDQEDANIAWLLSPQKAKITAHGKGTGTEITTLNLIRDWVKSHPDWYVLYFHSKGLSHPENPNTRWRLNMEQHVLREWRKCVLDLDKGADACGCYWLTPEEHPGLIQEHPFFGGNFWFAKSNYLATLPPLPPAEFVYRYHAESWIGSGPRRPRVVNYLSGWPPQAN